MLPTRVGPVQAVHSQRQRGLETLAASLIAIKLLHLGRHAELVRSTPRPRPPGLALVRLPYPCREPESGLLAGLQTLDTMFQSWLGFLRFLNHCRIMHVISAFDHSPRVSSEMSLDVHERLISRNIDILGSLGVGKSSLVNMLILSRQQRYRRPSPSLWVRLLADVVTPSAVQS